MQGAAPDDIVGVVLRGHQKKLQWLFLLVWDKTGEMHALQLVHKETIPIRAPASANALNVPGL